MQKPLWDTALLLQYKFYIPPIINGRDQSQERAIYKRCFDFHLWKKVCLSTVYKEPG